MVNILSKKSAFSLIEALIVMTIVAVFVAVIASVVPHKVKPKVAAEAHGGFECYWGADDKLYSRVIAFSSEGNPKLEEGVDDNGKNYCLFRPVQYAPYLIFNAVGGGAKGGDEKGGGAGQFVSAFIPVPQASYKLYPGKGGSGDHTDGYDTTVYSFENSETPIVTALGGSDTVSAENTKVEDILNVYADVSHMESDIVGYGCNYTPRAWLGDDQKIHVEFCKTSADVVETTLEYSNKDYSSIQDKYKTIIDSPVRSNDSSKVLSRLKPGTVDTWEYYDIGVFLDKGIDLSDPSNLPHGCTYQEIIAMDNPMCPSRYKLEIQLNIPDNGDEGAVSSMTKYADLMNYTNLNSINPGNGGAKGYSNGKNGAVLVSW